MTQPYSSDLRERVVRAHLAGEPIRQVAARFGVSVSSVPKWAARFRETGSVAPGRIGGHRPWLLEPHRALVHRLVAETPHLTIDRLRDLRGHDGDRPDQLRLRHDPARQHRRGGPRCGGLRVLRACGRCHADRRDVSAGDASARHSRNVCRSGMAFPQISHGCRLAKRRTVGHARNVPGSEADETRQEPRTKSRHPACRRTVAVRPGA